VNVVIAIAVILWARYARVIRGQVLTLMELDFITQARIAGASAARIILRHLFQHPQHADGPGHAPGRLRHHRGASLSFLGAGIPPPTPAWAR